MKKQYKNIEGESYNCTYGNVERHFHDLNLEVLHLYRDHREDWGDDGGYIIAIYRQKGRYCVGVIRVNYNCTVEGLNLTLERMEEMKNEPDDSENFIDFVDFDSLQDAQDWIDGFVNDLLICNKLLEEDDDFEVSYPPFETDYPVQFLEVCLFAFSEYPMKDATNLRKLSSTPYIQCFLDENLDWED